MRRCATGCVALAIAALHVREARAGDFDAQGEYHAAPDAVAYVDFSTAPLRYVPDDADDACKPPGFRILRELDALDGATAMRLQVDQQHNCSERLLVALPAKKGSYRASIWIRHGIVSAQMTVNYPDASGIPTMVARLFPTGRTTSDGWMELGSNEFSVDGAAATRAYLRIDDSANLEGTDVDGFEIVEAGTYSAPTSCAGLADPVCGDEGFCVYGECVMGRQFFPRLPDSAMRDAVVDELRSRIELFFGGRFSRANYLPDAIGTVEKMRQAKTAWQFWRLWLSAIEQLHDWHTEMSVGLGAVVQPKGRLNACFIEGVADRSHGTWPKDDQYADILVSHTGGDAARLLRGDRLVAVDGQHPIAWARSLIGVPGYHVATDPNSLADFPEALGGSGFGGALIVRYATNFTVIRCDPSSGTCSNVVETIDVASLPPDTGAQGIACDNRPTYHLEADGEDCLGSPCPLPDPKTHYVFGSFFRGRVAGTSPDEGIYSMVWDTLYGGGDPNSTVNQNIAEAIAFWKANARGVILDHRAGNGGTLDAAQNVTKLVRPPEPFAVIRMPTPFVEYDGPNDASEGVAIFNQFKNTDDAYVVGDAGYDPTLPVALVIHRDGSASDYMPFGMKGAPNVRVFGPPHGTAGAFSTFIQFNYYAGFSFQFASGDTIAADGSALIGHSVLPDEPVLPKQSDLLAGKDTIFEAALAWVRQELKP